MMPLIVEVLLIFFGCALFFLVAAYFSGLGLKRVCMRILRELKDARAFNEKSAVYVQDERRNFFLVGTKNLRPRAIKILMEEGFVIKTPNGKYYLNREKLKEVL